MSDFDSDVDAARILSIMSGDISHLEYHTVSPPNQINSNLNNFVQPNLSTNKNSRVTRDWKLQCYDVIREIQKDNEWKTLQISHFSGYSSNDQITSASIVHLMMNGNRDDTRGIKIHSFLRSKQNPFSKNPSRVTKDWAKLCNDKIIELQQQEQWKNLSISHFDDRSKEGLITSMSTVYLYLNNNAYDVRPNKIQSFLSGCIPFQRDQPRVTRNWSKAVSDTIDAINESLNNNDENENNNINEFSHCSLWNTLSVSHYSNLGRENQTTSASLVHLMMNDNKNDIRSVNVHAFVKKGINPFHRGEGGARITRDWKQLCEEVVEDLNKQDKWSTLTITHFEDLGKDEKVTSASTVFLAMNNNLNELRSVKVRNLLSGQMPWNTKTIKDWTEDCHAKVEEFQMQSKWRALKIVNFADLSSDKVISTSSVILSLEGKTRSIKVQSLLKGCNPFNKGSMRLVRHFEQECYDKLEQFKKNDKYKDMTIKYFADVSIENEITSNSSLCLAINHGGYDEDSKIVSVSSFLRGQNPFSPGVSRLDRDWEQCCYEKVDELKRQPHLKSMIISHFDDLGKDDDITSASTVYVSLTGKLSDAKKYSIHNFVSSTVSSFSKLGASPPKDWEQACEERVQELKNEGDNMNIDSNNDNDNDNDSFKDNEWKSLAIVQYKNLSTTGKVISTSKVHLSIIGESGYEVRSVCVRSFVLGYNPFLSKRRTKRDIEDMQAVSSVMNEMCNKGNNSGIDSNSNNNDSSSGVGSIMSSGSSTVSSTFDSNDDDSSSPLSTEEMSNIRKADLDQVRKRLKV